MVIHMVSWVHCGSGSLIRNGLTRNGKQGYKCKSCGRQSREGAQPERYSAAQKEQMLRAYNERSSMRGITRVFGVSRPTLIDWLKKRS